MNNKNLGRLGEDIAVEYLKKKGYKIIKRNFQNKWGEIDIIAKYNDIIVFVEVKTRIGEQFGLPEDAINKNKICRLVKNAEKYMVFRNETPCRADAVCIVLGEQYNLKRINHYENITN